MRLLSISKRIRKKWNITLVICRNMKSHTEPIGIILGAYQDKLVMHYALQNITNQVFVSRYQLYLPNREQLEAEFRRFMRSEEGTE